MPRRFISEPRGDSDRDRRRWVRPPPPPSSLEDLREIVRALQPGGAGIAFKRDGTPCRRESELEVTFRILASASEAELLRSKAATPFRLSDARYDGCCDACVACGRPWVLMEPYRRSSDGFVGVESATWVCSACELVKEEKYEGYGQIFLPLAWRATAVAAVCRMRRRRPQGLHGAEHVPQMEVSTRFANILLATTTREQKTRFPPCSHWQYLLCESHQMVVRPLP